MPYANNSELPPGVKDNLPDAAQTMYRDVFNSAWTGSCKDAENKDQCAAKEAWAVVHKNFHKDTDGSWTSNKSLVEDFAIKITKASYDKVSGERRWSGTLSDTQKDTYNEKMSLQLFTDFINHITHGDPIPAPYQTDYFKGGMPYVSLAHYPDLNGKAILGKTTDLYVDGKMLKAKGTFEDSPLGRAAFTAVCKSLYDTTDKTTPPVRLSIGFLDMGHVHGDKEFVRQSLSDVCPMCLANVGDKEYRSGFLIHEALTRVPVNSRTEIFAEVNKSMDGIKTQLDDAASIVGEDLAKEVDTVSKTMVGKSEALVIKSEEVPVVEAPKTETVIVTASDGNGKVTTESISLNADGGIVGDVLHPAGMPDAQRDEPKDMAKKVKEQQQTVIPSWAEDILNMLRQLTGQKAPENGIYQKSYTQTDDPKLNELLTIHPIGFYINDLMSIFDSACANTQMDKPQKLQSIQEAFSKLGEGIKKKIAELPDYPQPAIPTEAKSSAMIADAVTKAVANAMQPLVDQVSLITQQMGTVQGTRSVTASIPQRRSINPIQVQQQQSQVANPKSETPKLREIINRTLG
jgi:Putative cation transport regulator